MIFPISIWESSGRRCFWSEDFPTSLTPNDWFICMFQRRQNTMCTRRSFYFSLVPTLLRIFHLEPETLTWVPSP